MTDRDALLRAIVTDPADDVPRLVFADWLQEHGEEDRAEFIRLQVADPGRVVLFGRKKLPAGRWRWGVTRFGLPAFFRWERLATAIARTVLPPEQRTLRAVWRDVRVTLSRGFIAAVEVPSRAWMLHGPTLVREQPVESLKLVPQLVPRPDLLAWAREKAGLPMQADGRHIPSGEEP